jgi:hypothetical protein
VIFPEQATLSPHDPAHTGGDYEFRCFMVPVSPDNVVRQQVPSTGIVTKVTYRMFHAELPPPHQIRKLDVVIWRGLHLDVIGVPMMVTTNGRVHHYETYLGVETPG